MSVIGYTAGVFDLFHVGHLNVLKRARSQCDHLIVGVTTDDLSVAVKNKQPIVPLLERMEIVQSMQYVDHVVPQVSMDKMEAWRNLQFDVMFVGDDWKGTPTWDRLEKEFAQVQVQIAYFPYTHHTSSTLLRRALEQRESA